MNMKMSASLKPLSRDNVRTSGSVRNILNGRIHVIRISLAENGSLKDASPVDTCRRWRGLLLQRLQRVPATPPATRDTMGASESPSSLRNAFSIVTHALQWKSYAYIFS